MSQQVQSDSLGAIVLTPSLHKICILGQQVEIPLACIQLVW